MPETTPISATDMPDGDYAIVEVQGHRTLIGRISEIDRFGTKLLQVEPLFPEQFSMVESQSADLDGMAASAVDYIGAYTEARHPESEAGPDIGPTEAVKLCTKVAQMKGAA